MKTARFKQAYDNLVRGRYKTAHDMLIYIDKGKERAEVCFILGWMYYNGMGVQTNPNRAVDFFESAATMGHADAQYYLGKLGEEGRCIGDPFSETFQWYSLAILNSCVKAVLPLKEFTKKMTPEQIKDAKEYLERWKKSNPKGFPKPTPQT